MLSIYSLSWSSLVFIAFHFVSEKCVRGHSRPSNVKLIQWITGRNLSLNQAEKERKNMTKRGKHDYGIIVMPITDCILRFTVHTIFNYAEVWFKCISQTPIKFHFVSYTTHNAPELPAVGPVGKMQKYIKNNIFQTLLLGCI